MRVIVNDLFSLSGGEGELLNYIRDNERDFALREAEKIRDLKKHEVSDKVAFPDKKVWNTEYVADENGVPVATPKQRMKSVVRLPIDFNTYAIRQKSTLTCGAGIGLETNNPDSQIYSEFYDNYVRLKLEYDLQEVCETMMNETHCAVIFYTRDNKYHYKLVSPTRGDRLTPIYDDDTDDFIGFARSYQSLDEDYTDIYLKNGDRVYIERYKNDKLEQTINTPFRKLPVIYFEQSEHELFHIKDLLNLWEKEVSKFNESNEYFADPILYVKGSEVNLPTSTDRGQAIQSTGVDGDAKILTPDNATDMRKLQFEMLEKWIHKLSFVAPIDFQSLSGKGTMAASTLELLMIDAFMDASRRQNGAFGKGVQRMFNWLLDELKRVYFDRESDVTITPVFRRYSLKGESDIIEMYMKANGGLPLISHEESVELAGLANDTTFINGATTE